MGVSKTQLFDQRQNEIATVAKVLAHPARVAILQYISRQQACICSDLVAETGLAQATISQHLRELKEAGLIQGNISGSSMCYCIDPSNWQHVKDLFGELFSQYQQPCC